MLVNELGRFLADTTYDDLPSPVGDLVKLRILDLLGAGLAGFRIGLYRPLLAILGGKAEATVWGEGAKLPLRDAALLNSFMAHSTYLEDGSRFTGGHPSSVVIPGALSLGETRRLSGRDVILSVALGYEIFLRLGRAIYPSTVMRGFQSTAVLGAAACAAACAVLLRLDSERSKNALAIACNLGVGLKEALKAPHSQPLQVGQSCQGGVLSALYAATGVPGCDTILEHGFLKAFADHPNTTEILSGLGRRYRIEETYVKVHGGCRGNHAPTDVTQALVQAHRIPLHEIKEISVQVDSVTMAADIPDPQDGRQAQFSIPFSIAVALLEGNASIYQFTDRKVRDPRVRSVMARILVSADQNLDRGYPDKRGASAQITLVDGRRFSSSVANARGEPELPLSAREIEEKFLLLTRDILGGGAEGIRDQVRDLEGLQDISELVQRLTGHRGE